MNDNKIKRIAVIGGSGKAGAFLVRHCIENGYKTKLLLRSPGKFLVNSPCIDIVKGDARNPDSIRELLQGCTCVINTIGTSKGEIPLHTQVTQSILLAMNEFGIKRYIAVTGLTIDVPGDKKTFGVKILSILMKLMFRNIIADKQNSYKLLSQSRAEWTLVRIPFLLVEESIHKINTDKTGCKGKKITGGDLADFLIQQIEDKSLIGAAPFVSN